MAPYSYTQTNDSSDPIGRFISDRSRMAPPTKEEYDQLFGDFNKGSESAKQELIERHIRLVASIALKFRQVNVPMEDVMAEGIHGLIIAIEKFDHTRGIKLSTYAAWWIRQRIQRFVSKMAEAVSIPHDVSQGKRKENNLRTELQISLGRDPTDDEVKAALDDTRNLSGRVKYAPSGTMSLDEPFSEDSDHSLIDIMTDENESQQSYREEGSLADDIRVALGFLDQRERKVLGMRFGLTKDKEPMKLDDIAEILNVSGERVRQLEALGLRKLRAVVMNNGKLDFRNLDKLVGIELRGKTKMSPLQLSLILDNAA
ncbi:RNA polymerase sigma factor RpoD/SigA [Opitutales bacterium]|nr:RNA polymerase sigma factor RpoD/SigA [Opitutales bacterium]